MGKNDRFERIYSQGTMNVTEVWVDRETGVNYVFHAMYDELPDLKPKKKK